MAHSHIAEFLCRLDQPKVNENTSIPESGNSISNCRSAMGWFSLDKHAKSGSGANSFLAALQTGIREDDEVKAP